MSEQDKIQLFENQPIRAAWDSEQEEWYFSIVDVVRVLVDSPDYNTGRKYWNKLKQRLKEEGSQLGAVDKVPEIKRQGRFQARKKMPFGITLSV